MDNRNKLTPQIESCCVGSLYTICACRTIKHSWVECMIALNCEYEIPRRNEMEYRISEGRLASVCDESLSII